MHLYFLNSRLSRLILTPLILPLFFSNISRRPSAPYEQIYNKKRNKNKKEKHQRYVHIFMSSFAIINIIVSTAASSTSHNTDVCMFSAGEDQ